MIRELFLVIMTGLIPGVIVYCFDGVEGLKKFAEGATVANYLFFYFLLFFIAHVIFSTGSYYYGGKLSSEKRQKLKERVLMLGEVGDGLMGTYRLISGLLFFTPVIWKISDPNTLSYFQMLVLLGLSAAFFGGVAGISKVSRWAKQL
ncbi:hypothetical protein [Vibrio nigripulchritudo]|uniref:hypothetical protein n=1 Tax=Vibrio nigripulchritudo TaxID=28173 RepID=UPI0003B18F88|nr:hypothetical protein [Vibrio nigripulchritudo]CCN70389.1 membrane hypothetical protein [Vibrio nigripulchritudo SFn118]